MSEAEMHEQTLCGIAIITALQAEDGDSALALLEAFPGGAAEAAVMLAAWVAALGTIVARLVDKSFAEFLQGFALASEMGEL